MTDTGEAKKQNKEQLNAAVSKHTAENVYGPVKVLIHIVVEGLKQRRFQEPTGTR